MGQIAIGDVVKKFLELRAYKEKLEAESAEKIKPITTAMATLENFALAHLNATNTHNAAGDAGTVFKKTLMQLKVNDRDALFDFVAEKNKWDMLTSAVAKDAVKAFMEDTVNNPLGLPPPGVEPTFITKVEFRRA